MADHSGTNSVYKGPEGETTQWEDIQRKLGNLPEKAPVWKPEAYKPEAEEVRDAQWLEGKDADELEELEDEFGDDRFLEEYRRKRMEELRRGKAAPRFGALEEIRRSEFVQKVTNAGEGVWVVCLLYKDSVPDCAILAQCLGELATRYPGTKFVKIVSTDCIPQYPDANLPTVLLYRDTKCQQTLVGLRQFGGQSTGPDQVALTLNRFGEVCGDVAAQQAQLRSLVTKLVEQSAVAAAQQVRGQGGAGGGQDEDSDFED